MLLKFFFIFLAINLSLQTNQVKNNDCPVRKAVICYWASWAVYRPAQGAHKVENIDPSYCTHLVYTFAGLSIEGDIQSLDSHNDIVNGGYKQFVALKESNPCLKILLAIGGWNEGSEKYSLAAETEESRTRFADKIIRFLVNHSFDGLDVDWEYPTQRGGIPEDRDNFIYLLRALRKRLQLRNRILSVAVGASVNVSREAYDIEAMCHEVNFVSIMGYDMQIPGETSIHSPLRAEFNEPQDRETLKKTVDYYKIMGCPSNKIILGVPAYGRTFTLEDQEKTSIGAPITGPGRESSLTREAGFMGFNEICEIQKARPNWHPTYLERNAAAYGWLTKFWVSFDDPKTILEKAQFALEENLGGMMIWSIDTDDFQGKCGQGAYPLLRAINEGLGNPLKEEDSLERF